jgi:hypothetical protein
MSIIEFFAPNGAYVFLCGFEFCQYRVFLVVRIPYICGVCKHGCEEVKTKSDKAVVKSGINE